MKILITGGNGFIAKNLNLFLKERSNTEIFIFSRKNKISELTDFINKVDFFKNLPNGLIGLTL